MKTSLPINHPKGFALIVTLSLMILLTVIAVGLLTLSSISLRSSGQGNAMSVARSNAKLALMLAIGELQKNAGPDMRITAPANLANTTAPVGVASAPTGITGVWNSSKELFSNTDYITPKTGTNFLGYLMSNPNPQDAPDPKTLPGGNGKLQKLVGAKTVGTNNSGAEISAPMVSIAGIKANVSAGGLSWVTLDEGMKGRIDLLPAGDPTGQGEEVTQVGSAARNGFETVEKMDFLKAGKSKLMIDLPKLISLNEANLAADTPDAVAKYFHDFTVASNSLQVDVANGGLKTDLSVLFDGVFGAPVQAPFSNKYLYSDSSAPFQGASTTSDVQWEMLANYARLYRRTTPNDNPKVGLKAALPPKYSLRKINDVTLKQDRVEPDMALLKQPVLMPTVLRVDTVFSLVTRKAHAGHGTTAYPYQLHLMYLPVITLHNPYNVPLRVNGLQVEFSDIPVGFEFLINGEPCTTTGLVPINQMSLKKAGNKKTFNMQISNTLKSASEVVMGAGETRIFGTPFPPDTTWANEVNTNGTPGGFFDWDDTQTGGGNTGAALTIPGMITGALDGVGFDIDYLAPKDWAPWFSARIKNFGTPIINDQDTIQVRYGPVIPATASSTNSFSVTVKMGAIAAGTTQIFYSDAGRLSSIMSEGTSPRFPEKRTFPDTWPRAGESPKRRLDIYEEDSNPVKKYSRARPFAIFSVSAKTTVESFTKSRPVADTGIAFQMATCDFTTSASAGASPLEFALVPVKSGGLVIESGGLTDAKGTSLQGFFFGGHGTRNGINDATLFEIPMAPLQSIAQLRHANSGSIGSIPYVTYTVGESRAHPALPAEVAFFKPDASRTVLDRSWLANDQLWDRYWFSTLSTLQGMAYAGSASSTQAQLATDFFTGTKQLPNPRNVPYLSSGKTVAQISTAARAVGATAPYAPSAAYILTKGGFNVNSTSVPAWISVLSSLATSDVPLAAGTNEKDPAGTPFLRIRQPVKGAASTLDPKTKLWNSYRTLDNDEIKKLAEEIVTEVKARGPFLSMAEFVNRRLGTVSDDPITGKFPLKGALQAALDRSGINGTMLLNARAVTPEEVLDYGWKNDKAVETTTGAGSPGEVSQGDILSAIGSFVTVRSDTFKIRAYGDAKDGGGKVTARAWCEATVQRVPEFVDASEAPETALADLKSPVNLTFGRQFKMMSFRWLHPDEI